MHERNYNANINDRMPGSRVPHRWKRNLYEKRLQFQQVPPDWHLLGARYPYMYVLTYSRYEYVHNS